MTKNDKPLTEIGRSEPRTQGEAARDEALERFREVAERIGARNADKDPGEVMRIVTEVVEEVRQEHYERRQRAGCGH